MKKNEYRLKVFAFLEQMKVGQIIVLKSLIGNKDICPKAETLPFFQQYFEEYAIMYQQKLNQDQFEYNFDKTKIKRF